MPTDGLRSVFRYAQVAVVACAMAAATVQACGPAGASGAVSPRFFGMHAVGLPEVFPQANLGSVNLTTNGVYWPRLETSRESSTSATWTPSYTQRV